MTLTRSIRRVIRRSEPAEAAVVPPLDTPITAPSTRAPVDIGPSDPLLTVLLSASGPVDVTTLELDSTALRALCADGVRLVVPLVSQGELIGTLNLGPRRSEQDYSSDDRRLLESLAAQAAPALRVGQLVHQQEGEARERQRMEQELQVAQLIQRNFLPRELPDLPGWTIAAHYQPARQVGGDFYDVFTLPDGRLGLVIGDVTDKGVPAALIMAATRTLLRASAQRLVEPGLVLERVNDALCPDMPERMFVTCLYGVLDPANGVVRFANAGHDVPYMRCSDGSAELRASGMPLGLMAGMTYEEREVRVEPGSLVVFHSDGIVEAHAPDRAMFGFPRLRDLVGRLPIGEPVVPRLLAELAAFTGPDWVQEDDITLVVVERSVDEPGATGDATRHARVGEPVRPLLDVEIPSAAGNERLAIRQLVEATAGLGIGSAHLERIKTAVGEAVMNAIEHGNGNDPTKPVRLLVRVELDRLIVEVTDLGGDHPMPETIETPDLEAKLAGDQSPRGWGRFLIQSMADGTADHTDGIHYTLELTFGLGGNDDAHRSS